MTLFGPDGSHWQFKPKASFDLALSESDWDAIDFMLWRSSIGTRGDSTFARMRDAADAHDVAFSAYHWVYPTGRYPARDQAATMANVNPSRDIPVMLDWETESGLFPTIDDCDKVADAMRALGYRVPLLYTGGWYWSLPQIGKPTLTGRGYELVLSDYNTNPPLAPLPAYNMPGGDHAGEWSRSLGGLRPVIWQYGSRVRFGNMNWDMNACRASVNDLARWFHIPGGVVVDNPPAPDDPPVVVDPLPREELSMYFVGFRQLESGGPVFAVYSNGRGRREKLWMKDVAHWNAVKGELLFDGYSQEEVDGFEKIKSVDYWRGLGPVIGPIPYTDAATQTPVTDGWGAPLR